MEFFVFSPPFKRYGPRNPICIEKFLTWNFVIKNFFLLITMEIFFFLKGAGKRDSDLWNRNQRESVENRLGKYSNIQLT